MALAPQACPSVPSVEPPQNVDTVAFVVISLISRLRVSKTNMLFDESAAIALGSLNIVCSPVPLSSPEKPEPANVSTVTPLVS
jgi:hypothetical protein